MSGAENPPAFPVAEVRIDGCGITEGYPGMTLRDWFAGRALNAFVAAAVDGDLRIVGDQTPAQVIADQAYTLADAMLAERSKS